MSDFNLFIGDKGFNAEIIFSPTLMEIPNDISDSPVYFSVIYDEKAFIQTDNLFMDALLLNKSYIVFEGEKYNIYWSEYDSSESRKNILNKDRKSKVLLTLTKD